MKGFKKKIMTMALSVMMVVSMFGNVASAGGVDTLGIESVKYGIQKLTVSPGPINYFEYIPTTSGKQSVTVKVPEGYITNPAIFLSEDDIPTVYGVEENESYINFNFKAGEEYYVAFYVTNEYYEMSGKAASGLEVKEESEVEATLTIGEPKTSIYVVEDSYSEYKHVKNDNVKGLSWDINTNTLTMNNYNAEDEVIRILNMDCIDSSESGGGLVDVAGDVDALDMSDYFGGNLSLNEKRDGEYEDIYYNVTLYIKGVNNLKNVRIFVDCGINLTIKGDGELNFIDNQISMIKLSHYGVYCDAETGNIRYGSNYDGKLILDGATINANGNCGEDAIITPNFEMKSGTMYLEISPRTYTNGGTYATYADIYSWISIKITGGNLVVKYEGVPEGAELYSNKTDNGEPLYVYNVIYSNDILVENATVVITGDKDVAEKLGTPYLIGEIKDGKLEIAKSATYLIGNPIDISKLKVELSETSYDYDGTAKTPSVKVAGLKEGVDFEVAYKNNVESGTATVTVTGLGCFSGSVDVTFEIVKEATADGPKAGTTIKDKKYVYKVTKAGSKDGSIVGELEVTGLKKKSLTQIKIAATVKIGGVSYKVTSVGAKAFKGNKKITKVFVGMNVKEIGANAFANCTKLKQVTINAKGLKSIGKNAFAGDKKLKKIIVKSTKLKKVGKKALKGTSKKIVVKVPKAKKKAYKKLFKKAGNKKVKVK